VSAGGLTDRRSLLAPIVAPVPVAELQWMKVFADVLEVPVVLARTPRASAPARAR